MFHQPNAEGAAGRERSGWGTFDSKRRNELLRVAGDTHVERRSEDNEKRGSGYLKEFNTLIPTD